MLPAAMIARGTATWRPWTLGVRPGAYAFLGRRAVPFAIPGGEREVVEGGDCHVASFPVA